MLCYPASRLRKRAGASLLSVSSDTDLSRSLGDKDVGSFYEIIKMRIGCFCSRARHSLIWHEV
jgi:hypothetical protein